jgi:hypothetical protein
MRRGRKGGGGKGKKSIPVPHKRRLSAGSHLNQISCKDKPNKSQKGNDRWRNKTSQGYAPCHGGFLGKFKRNIFLFGVGRPGSVMETSFEKISTEGKGRRGGR